MKRFAKFHKRTAWQCLGLLLGLLSCQLLAAAGNDPDVEDLYEKHHFLSVGDMYTDGHAKLLCVETSPKKYSLWNPADDSFSFPTEKESCSVKQNFHSLFDMIRPIQLPGGPPETPPNQSSFSGGAIYEDDHGLSGNCGPNQTTSYAVIYRNGATESFYLVVRLKKPKTKEIGEDCDGPPEKIVQQFDTDSVIFLNSVDLGNGKSLIYEMFDERPHDGDPVQPILLLVKKLPKTVWSSNRNIFIVPGSYLSKSLSWEAGFNLARRYKSVLDAIGESP